MPSFDVVSEVDVQEVDNAVNQAEREIGQRYDFKGAKTELVFDKAKCEIRFASDNEARMDAMLDVINSKLFKRGVELGSLDISKREPAGGMTLRQSIRVKQGLEQDAAKSIVKLIKETKLKVEVAIQDKQLRVTGKKIDDLQEVISFLRGQAGTLKVPLQYINMRN